MCMLCMLCLLCLLRMLCKLCLLFQVVSCSVLIWTMMLCKCVCLNMFRWARAHKKRTKSLTSMQMWHHTLTHTQATCFDGLLYVKLFCRAALRKAAILASLAFCTRGLVHRDASILTTLWAMRTFAPGSYSYQEAHHKPSMPRSFYTKQFLHEIPFANVSL